MISITLNPENVAHEEYASYKERKAARGLILDSTGKIGVLYVSVHRYYKLPGGGVEEHENMIQALQRESLEELGGYIVVKDIQPFATTVEIRKEHRLVQHSVYYMGWLESLTGQQNYEQNEIRQGFTPLWLPLEDAIQRFALSEPDNYDGWFISQRDSLVLIAFAKQVLWRRE